MRWPMLQYRDRHRDKLPPRLLKGIEDGVHIGHDTYRAALIERENFRTMHDALAQRSDGFITLSSPGPGPIGMDQGSAIFNEASSILGAPALNLPLLAVDEAPVGIQLLGRWHSDESLTALGRWLAEVHFGKPA
jgi:Asp-tRNA(Asn)/Glu-tRNA(Gln) amidotransferase A subunit family amidase